MAYSRRESLFVMAAIIGHKQTNATIINILGQRRVDEGGSQGFSKAEMST